MKLLPFYNYKAVNGTNFRNAILFKNNASLNSEETSQTFYYPNYLTDADKSQQSYLILKLEKNTSYHFYISKSSSSGYYWDHNRAFCYFYNYEDFTHIQTFEYYIDWEDYQEIYQFDFTNSSQDDKIVYLKIASMPNYINVSPPTKNITENITFFDYSKNYNLQNNISLKKYYNTKQFNLTKNLTFPKSKCLCYFDFQNPSIYYANYSQCYQLRSLINDYTYLSKYQNYYMETSSTYPTIHSDGFNKRCARYFEIYVGYYSEGGVQSYINISNYVFADIAFSFWFYYDGGSNYDNIVSYGFVGMTLEQFVSSIGWSLDEYNYYGGPSYVKDANNADKGIGILMSSNKLGVRFGTKKFISNNVINSSSWNNIVVSYNSTNKHITSYVNGVKCSFTVLGNTQNYIDVSDLQLLQATKIYIGTTVENCNSPYYTNDPRNTFNNYCYLDQLAIFHTALTESQAKHIYNDGQGAFL